MSDEPRGPRDPAVGGVMPKRIQRRRVPGWRMPEGAVYVGRPSRWGNPWREDAKDAVWWAVAIGEKGNAAGRRAGAVAWFRWWLTGDPGRLPIPARRAGPGDIEYSDGTTVHIADAGTALAVMMLAKDGRISIPPQPTDGDWLAPLRGRDLACWCPEQCDHEVALTGAAYGEIYDRCTKPTGHDGPHDPSAPMYCHADLLLELANR